MLKVKKLREDAIIPKKAYNGDAGFDVFSTENFVIFPGKIATIGLGLAVEFDNGNVLRVDDKSGLAVKKGIFTIAGIIDSTYRGEIHVCLVNFSDVPVTFNKGQKIAQIILMPCYTGNGIIEIKELSNTDRGTGGFGSTGDR